MVDPAQLAILVGLANGGILLLKPIGRLHERIDSLERSQASLQIDVNRLIGALGVPPNSCG